MRNKLNANFGDDKLVHSIKDKKEFYVVDFTERTKSARSVEVLVTPEIDPLIVKNPTKLSITTSIFKPQSLVGKNNKEIKQCECVMYPTHNNDSTWIMFIEIKDCKPGNAAEYYKEVKEKFEVNVGFFREKGIISEKKVVYAVASFPRKDKTNFHNHLIKATEWKKFRDDHKIMIKGTNQITVKNNISIL